MSADLGVVGLGYAGLPLVLRAIHVGMSVVGLDIDAARIRDLSAGRSPIPGIDDGDIPAPGSSGVVFSTEASDLAGCSAISICVPTPLKDHAPDLSAVTSAARTVGSILRQGQLIVLESTTYPGTTEEVVLPILEAESGLSAGTEFSLGYSPERIDPANRHFGLENTPRIISGIDQPSVERMAEVYGALCNEVVRAATVREAEMAKLLENTYRHVNIALINELALLCHSLGIDIWNVVELAASKPFGFDSFRPGPGVGGHCIPIDPHYLADHVRRMGHSFQFVELAQSINDSMPVHVLSRLVELLNRRGLAVSRSRILLGGVAYKKNVADTRGTPAEPIVRGLRNYGATVAYVDPLVDEFSVDGIAVERVEQADLEEAYDCLVVLTDHDLLDLERLSGHAESVFDTRGVMPATAAERL